MSESTQEPVGYIIKGVAYLLDDYDIRELDEIAFTCDSEMEPIYTWPAADLSDNGIILRANYLSALVRIKELEAKLTEVGNIAHHGGLIGFTNVNDALTQIRRLTLTHWDGDECTRLQMESI